MLTMKRSVGPFVWKDWMKLRIPSVRIVGLIEPWLPDCIAIASAPKLKCQSFSWRDRGQRQQDLGKLVFRIIIEPIYVRNRE
jgi:hypothetical protein